MRYFNFLKNKIHLSFAADDVGRLGLIYIGKENKKLKSNNFFTPVEVFATGENPDEHHGAKHIGSSLSNSLKYISHSEINNEIIFTLQNNKLRIKQHYILSQYLKFVNISPDIFLIFYIIIHKRME